MSFCLLTARALERSPDVLTDRLHHALGALTRGPTELLDAYGAVALESAVGAALGQDTAHLAAVRHFADQQRTQRGQAPPIPVILPDDPLACALSPESCNERSNESDSQSDHGLPEPTP